MRNRHGMALCRLAAAATVTTALASLGAGVAMAAPQHGKPSVTPGCSVNSYCSDPVFNAEFGPQYFVNNANGVQRRGNPVNLSWADDTNPGEDWHVTLQATVSVLYHLGYIGAAMELHYRSQPVVEVMWTPYGVTSNLCRGTAKAATEGEKITLQPCGSFPETLWVVDPDSGELPGLADGGNPLIAGSDRNPSVPYVMTAGGGLLGSDPFDQLRVEQLVADDGVPDPAQLWCTATETLPSAGGTTTFEPNVPCFPDEAIGAIKS
jgi:hypothetical protein